MTVKVQNNGGKRSVPWRLLGWSAAASVLLLPLVAMQFSKEVNWTVSDFAFMGALVGGVGLALEVASRATGNRAYQAAVGVALAAAAFLIWINGAVGIIGSENEVGNQLYGAVLLIVLVGALLVQFRPSGLTRVMVAAAVAQVLVPVTALMLEWSAPALIWSQEVTTLTVGFAAMWLVSAWLFSKAAH